MTVEKAEQSSWKPTEPGVNYHSRIGLAEVSNIFSHAPKGMYGSFAGMMEIESETD